MRDMAAFLQCFWGLSLLFSLYYVHSVSTSHVYIVYLGQNQLQDPLLNSKSHVQLLSNVFASEEEAKQSLLYSYKHSFSGFSAKLNSTQATTLAKMTGVISVFRSKILKLHTTRSWDFIGLSIDNSTTEVTPLQLAYGDDIVVGVFDTGIWPESESFKEAPNLGPVPSCWKGQCVEGQEFEPKIVCNKKLIGARYYIKGFEQEFGPLNTTGNPEYRSARDFLGHGTHIASTAVGSIARNANFLGFARGTARGGAPRARLAVYKVCWRRDFDGKCAEADILAAFDDALYDGVNVISASFGSTPPLSPFFASSAGIGSFHAMQLGVTVVFSGGNDGPDPSLVGNVSPWSICVAASSIDRTFPTQIVLNNNFTTMGESLITTEIRGKLAGATMYFDDGLPAVQIVPSRTEIGISPAPIVAPFSSRGPSSISPDFLKPDVSAPGINILAAWPPKTPPTLSPSDSRSVNWNFQSGTSMSCPHVSGVVAILKSAHPDWSPAIIRSALITTALTTDTTFDTIQAGGSMKASDPFDIGAGHINPLKAMDPGLVYDMKTCDYIIFLFNIGYTAEQINKFLLPSARAHTTCTRIHKTNANINYPSITVLNLQYPVTIKRTVRNVGRKKNDIYFVSIAEPDGVQVMIWPRVLFFSCFKEEISYFVTLKPLKKSRGRFDFGEIVWSDGFHKVRSPLIVSVNTSGLATHESI